MTKYKLTLTKIIDADDPLLDCCYDDTTEQLAPVELMADELKRMFDCGYVDALNVLQDATWSVEEVGNNLARTIPANQITLGKGEPVFPELRKRLTHNFRHVLLDLVNQREAYGIAKYGQTLHTDDNRDTPTEVVNEVLDMLAYLTKWSMQEPDNLRVKLFHTKALALACEIVEEIQETKI